MKRLIQINGAILFALILTGIIPQAAESQGEQFDLLILNGQVLDGTGNPWFQRDIAVRGNTIVAIGDLKKATAKRVIDARGLYVTPGFIDLHSHADRGLVSDYLEARKAPSLVTQGVTTVVSGSDGFNIRWPLTAEITAYESKGIAVNAILMVGHHTLISEVMGSDYERRPTEAERSKMRALVRQGMEQGGWGLAAGLEYRPGRFATTEEVIELAKIAAEYNGFYIAHPRSESMIPMWQLPSLARKWEVDGLQAIEELIRIARETGLRVVGTHHKAKGRSSFGRSIADIKLINKARSDGLQVFLDVYPYDTWGGVPWPHIPAWACVAPGVDSSGGNDSPVYQQKGIRDNWREHLRRNWENDATRRVLERDLGWLIDRSGGADRIWILDYPDRSWVGKVLAQLALEQRKTPEELLIEMALNGYKDVSGGVRLRGLGMIEEDIENYLRQDYAAIGSDSLVSGVKGVPGFESQPGYSPRDFGAFIRPIARYVKEKKVISLSHAVRAQTWLPAQIIGLPDRGMIREGYKADLVVFDLERLRDRATIFQPGLFSEGIEYTIVNGQFTLDRGKMTGALPGVVLKRGPLTHESR